MKTLKINDWMAWEMFGYLFFAVYAVSATEWWILGKADDIDTACEILAKEIAVADEDACGEFFVINAEGRRV